ncbi:MAG: WXG100 family type VII secretion target [Oscillospiraceae bacterium]
MEIIRVTPEQLKTTASEIQRIQSEALRTTNSMTEIVNSMRNDWTGDAANMYSQRFNGLQDDMQTLNRILGEHVSDLEEMANTYTLAEDAAEALGSSLASDVIS